jgi:hypothetical protein
MTAARHATAELVPGVFYSTVASVIAMPESMNNVAAVVKPFQLWVINGNTKNITKSLRIPSFFLTGVDWNYLRHPVRFVGPFLFTTLVSNIV